MLRLLQWEVKYINRALSEYLMVTYFLKSPPGIVVGRLEPDQVWKTIFHLTMM